MSGGMGLGLGAAAPAPEGEAAENPAEPSWWGPAQQAEATAANYEAEAG